MDDEGHLIPQRVSEVETMVGGTSCQSHSACGEETDVVQTSLQAKKEDGGVSKAPDDSYDRPFATRCYERVLSPTTGQGTGLEQILLRDAALVDNPQEAQTFWLPAGCKPTTSLEKIAASIFDFHSKNLWYDKGRVNGRSQNVNLSAASLEEAIPHRGTKRPRIGREGGDGAEWWIQIRREGEHADLGMPFHWDKDEQLLERHGVLVYPAVSTVTYLSDNGAPTVVFKSRATGEGAVVAGSMDRAFVSYPVLFKHLAFDGGFLHGVPQAMMRENSQCYHRHMRVTLLVNVWLSHKPSGVVPLPRSIAASLSRPSGVPELSFERPVEFHPVSVEGTMAANNEGGVLEISGGSTVTVEAPLGPTCYLAFHAPSSKKLSTGDCEGRHSFLVSFENGKDARILTKTTEGLPVEKR